MKFTPKSCLPALCLMTLCMTAVAGPPTYTLIVGPRTALGPLAGIPANLSYTPISGSIVDLNGDGAADIVLGINGAPPAVYLNNRTDNPFQGVSGNFVSPPPGANQSGISWGVAAVADVNKDGHPDLAIGGFNTPNMVYLNDGTASPFNGVAGIAIGTQDTGSVPAVADVNGDGFPDLAISNTNHVPSQLYLTHGAPLTSGGYTTVQVGTDVGYGEDTKIADVNGDGKPDLILTYEFPDPSGTDPSGMAIYLNNGTGDPFGGVTPLRMFVGKSVFAVGFADFDNDGKQDMSVTISDLDVLQQTLEVLLNTGSPSQPYSASQTLQPDQNTGGCLGVGTGDVNGDSRPDLLFACVAPSSNFSPTPTNPAIGAVYLNNGTANPFAGVAPVDIPAPIDSGYGRTVAVGTFVTNGRPNVLVVDSSGANYYPTILDQDPVAQNDSAVGAVNTSIPIALLDNDSAGPGQALDATTVKITMAPGHGTLNVSSNGTATYQPAGAYSGADSFQYTVCDALGARSHAATVSITVQPAPVAANDLKTLAASQSVALNVLGNDTSAGGTLDTASIQIAVAPIHGSAVVMNGQVVYSPSNGYAGVDAFQYTVQDNLRTVSNVATVSLSIQPSPVASNDAASLQANQNVTIDVLANDKSDGGTLDTASISIDVAPAHGTATVNAGHIAYTPTPGYSGSDSLQYSVKDNLGGRSNVATVSIDVAAPPQTGNGGGSGNTGAGSGGGGGGSMRWLDLVALALLLVIHASGRRRVLDRPRVSN